MNPYESPKTENASLDSRSVKGEPELGALFALLLLFQFVVAGLLAPGDGGHWSFRMLTLFLAVDLFLAFRLFLIYKIRGRPAPAISGSMKFAILTSPVYMAVIGTYLMDIVPGF